MSFRKITFGLALAANVISASAMGASGTSEAKGINLETRDFEVESPSRLSLQLSSWLREQLAMQGYDVDVVAQGIWGVSSNKPMAVRAELATETREGGSWQITLRLTQPANVGMVHLAVAKFGILEHLPVWTVGTRVRKGDGLSCGNLQRESRVRRSSLKPWQGDCSILSGQVARRALEVGDVLMSTDIGIVQAVQAQQEAVVVARVQGIEIQARGQVLADAAVGQRVPVKLNGQSHVIHGVVTGPAQVRVMEGM
jgi:flagella basal body P-ring formation protein FlgA